MRASEMIERLTGLMYRYGNCEVRVAFGNVPISDITPDDESTEGDPDPVFFLEESR